MRLYNNYLRPTPERDLTITNFILIERVVDYHFVDFHQNEGASAVVSRSPS